MLKYIWSAINAGDCRTNYPACCITKEEGRHLRELTPHLPTSLDYFQWRSPSRLNLIRLVRRYSSFESVSTKTPRDISQPPTHTCEHFESLWGQPTELRTYTNWWLKHGAKIRPPYFDRRHRKIMKSDDTNTVVYRVITNYWKDSPQSLIGSWVLDLMLFE